MQAMMKMQKIDINRIKRAYRKERAVRRPCKQKTGG